MAQREDLTGQKFGRLTALEYSSERGRWLCRCECGKQKWILPPSLKKGMTRSCGCLKSELARKAHLKHGKRFSKVYNAWLEMKQRCLNPNVKFYEHYGGRGITICERWMDFNNFYADMGDPPVIGAERISLDRIENNGNYEPGNCQWATQKMQSDNQRRTRFHEYQGESHTLCDWAKIKGMSYGQLRQRIYQRGWGFEEAITMPPRGVRHSPKSKVKPL
jgi:hypothetical protein